MLPNDDARGAWCGGSMEGERVTGDERVVVTGERVDGGGGRVTADGREGRGVDSMGGAKDDSSSSSSEKTSTGDWDREARDEDDLALELA